MRKLGILGLVIALAATTWLVMALGRPSLAQAENPGVPVKWEYSWASGFNETAFNKLGAQGWELCVAVRERDTASPVFVFKRPKR